jgi:hypothetical protein
MGYWTIWTDCLHDKHIGLNGFSKVQFTALVCSSKLCRNRGLCEESTKVFGEGHEIKLDNRFTHRNAQGLQNFEKSGCPWGRQHSLGAISHLPTLNKIKIKE